ncbi:MAG: hypothetical protein LBR62_01430 [Puniceicoccales bacterium]|jgi:hypothetical protein|nr:hypothetical protein [Puniceicoccales bacterium]
MMSLPGIRFRVFSDPEKAIEHIDKAPPPTFADRLISHLKNSGSGHHVMDLNLAPLHEELYNPDRFRQVSVVVSSYDLAGMNGVEFFDEIRSKNIQRILLTVGNQDRQGGDEALGRGIVHRCILKRQILSIQDLQNMVYWAQREYFYRLSISLHAFVGSGIDKSFCSAISYPEFIRFFNAFLKSHDIVEYYLFDAVGSCILLNGRGHVMFFCVQNSDQHEATSVELRAEVGQSISTALWEKVSLGKSIFCYPLLKGMRIPPVGQWKDFLLDAEPILLGADETVAFYWALGRRLPFVDLARITTANGVRAKMAR